MRSSGGGGAGGGRPAPDDPSWDSIISLGEGTGWVRGDCTGRGEGFGCGERIGGGERTDMS